MGELTPNKLFECEVRFFIDNIEAFKQHLNTLNAQLIRSYSFTDHYYQPLNGQWNNLEKSIRIREWFTPITKTVIYFTKQEIITDEGISFKKSLYPTGKIQFFEGTLELCRQILSDLDFKPSFSIQKKRGWVWQIPEHHLEFCAEETDLLGWTGEIELEGKDLQYIKESLLKHQEILQLDPKQMTFKPLATLIEERIQLSQKNNA
jgi:adenylate cyclase class IV